MEISVEMNGEDVTRRLLAGETLYFVHEETEQPEPAVGWPEGWRELGMTVER